MNRIWKLVPLLSLVLVASACQSRGASNAASSPTSSAPAGTTPASSAVAASEPAPASTTPAPAAPPEAPPAVAATPSSEAGEDELPAAPPPLTQAESRRDWSQALTLTERLSNLIVENRADCAKMGRELDKFVTANMPALTAVARFARSETPADKAAFEAKYGERQNVLKRRTKIALRACKGDAGVVAAITKIPSDRARREH